MTKKIEKIEVGYYISEYFKDMVPENIVDEGDEAISKYIHDHIRSSPLGEDDIRPTDY